MSGGIEAAIAARILAGKVVPFLGAGANMTGRGPDEGFEPGVRLPSGSELAAHLRSEAFGYDAGPELPRVAQHLLLTLGQGPLYEQLHELFDADYPPTALHRLLAAVPALLRRDGRSHQLIVTTNYDDALERAFAERGEEYDLLVYISAGDDRGRFAHIRPDGSQTVVTAANVYTDTSLVERTVILKIHGAVTRHAAGPDADSYVITEDDYIEYPIHEELSNFVPATLAKVLKSSHLLFLGYSLADWNLRVILHRLWGSRELSYVSWAVQAATTELDKAAWARRGDVKIITANLQPFVDELSRGLGLDG